MNDDERVLDALLRSDPALFLHRAFATLHPSDTYQHNWHIDAIIHELMALWRGNNRRLILNLPPRGLKSICTSVAFVAWALGQDPSRQFVVASYSLDLAKELHRQFRKIINADWYRRAFPHVDFDKQTDDEVITSKGGGRRAVSIGSTLTGLGMHFGIIDDPISESDAYSKSIRDAVNDWIRTTFLNRLNDKATNPIALVQQRLHQLDPSGVLSETGD